LPDPNDLEIIYKSYLDPDYFTNKLSYNKTRQLYEDSESEDELVPSID
jgi:hypothetical protein